MYLARRYAGGLHGHRPGDENNGPWRVADCAGNQVVPYGILIFVMAFSRRGIHPKKCKEGSVSEPSFRLLMD